VVTPSGRKYQSIDDSEALTEPQGQTNDLSVPQSIYHSISQSLLYADCVVITTNHSAFNAEMIKRHAKLIVDLRNVIKEATDQVYKL
jgi:UDP-N-acetyl-D-mannosaminuronate dehydrogenase